MHPQTTGFTSNKRVHTALLPPAVLTQLSSQVSPFLSSSPLCKQSTVYLCILFSSDQCPTPALRLSDPLCTRRAPAQIQGTEVWGVLPVVGQSAQTQSFHTGSFLALQASETPRGVPEVKAILVVVNTCAPGNFQDPTGDNVIALMAEGMCVLKLNF